MAHIRTQADLTAFRPTAMELDFVESCKTGGQFKLGTGSRPAIGKITPGRVIRAEVLRYLILGGCKKCKVQEAGVFLQGAIIVGDLNLEYCTTVGSVTLRNCVFRNKLRTMQMTTQVIDLDGSYMNGWKAQGMTVAGSVMLRGTHHNDAVSINGSGIGGQLNFRDSVLNVPGDIAIYGQNLTVKGHLMLNNLKANATIHLMSAHIGGQLNFKNSTLSAAKGAALQGQSIRVDDVMIWKNVMLKKGFVQFLSAQFRNISTDFRDWGNENEPKIDGMTYNRISVSSIDLPGLLRWVERGSHYENQFRPQPFTQLAKVLRNMGHDKTARHVLQKREELLRLDERNRLRRVPDPENRNYLAQLWDDVRVFAHWGFDKALKYVIGYGHRPFRSLLWLIAFWLTATCLAHKAWDTGDFAPASAILQASDDWKTIAAS